MDVKSLLEKLLFDEVEEEVIDEPLKDVKPVETIRVAEPIKPLEKPVREEVHIEEEKPAPLPVTKPRKALIDVTEVTYRPNYKTASSIEKAQYVRQEPLSPIFGYVSDKDKGVEKKLTTPQFPSDIEGSRKVEAVLSPIFGKDLPSEKDISAFKEEVAVIEKPVLEKPEEVKKPAEAENDYQRRYTPRHAEINIEDNDVFYTNGLELDKIISLLNESEESSQKTDEDTDFLNSVFKKSDEDSDTISIFEDED